MNRPTIKTLPLAEIRPYWRNPRENHEAVEKVAQSIRQYGYNQLIAVDAHNVIIAGHTRYLALQSLGYTDVDVIVLDLTDKQAKAYRIIDNKTAEFAKWTPDLVTELRELTDIPEMQDFFAEDIASLVGVSVGSEAPEGVTDAQVGRVASAVTTYGHELKEKAQKEIACPHCGELFLIAP